MQTVIKQYLRDKKNNPHGVAVAVKHNGEVYYGYSLCNPKDKFDRSFGEKIAIKRATSESYLMPESDSTHDKIMRAYEDLESRALKYFKDLPYSKVARPTEHIQPI